MGEGAALWAADSSEASAAARSPVESGAAGAGGPFSLSISSCGAYCQLQTSARHLEQPCEAKQDILCQEAERHGGRFSREASQETAQFLLCIPMIQVGIVANETILARSLLSDDVLEHLVPPAEQHAGSE